MSEKKEGIANLSRRQFLKDAGLVVGGTAVSSVFLLSACGKEIEVTKTVTTTAAQTTVTSTTTLPGSTITTTAAGATATVTKYTCPFCNQEFSTLAALKTHIEANHLTGALAEVVNLTINGKSYKMTTGDDIQPWEPQAYDVYPWDSLMHTLRDKLGLTGTKDNCERGACGTCTVLVDGKPALSCIVLTADCDGKEITTIEGLGTPNNPHPIQQAFIDNHGAQCGYCVPGMIMASKALLDQNSNPTVAEIQLALSGNLCRCGNYPFFVKSVQAAAQKL